MGELGGVVDTARAKAFRRLFFDLKAVWLDGPAPGSSSFGEGGRDDFNEWCVKPVAWGWASRAIRSAEAAVRLSDAGLSEETSPLLRSAIEHSMFLWWLQIERGKVIEVLKRAQKESLGKMIKAQSIGWAIDAPTLKVIQDLIDDANDQHKHLDALAKTGNLAQRYTDDLGNLFQAWLYDTQTSHATLQSASAYYSLIPAHDPGGPGFRLLRIPEAIDNVAAKAAVATQVALSGYSKASGLEGFYQPKLDRFTSRFAGLMAP